MGKKSDSEILTGVVQELIKVRKGLKITQAQVLNDTSIHIGRIEQGQRNMAIITFIRLCEYYGVKPSKILEDTDLS